MVTAGSNMAFLNSVLALADPGDEFILPMPYYFNQEMAIRMAGCVPVPVAVRDDWQLDVPALAAAITPRTRAIVTVSPNNPTGAVYHEADLRAVNALCARHGLYHFSDEAYEYFTYDGRRGRGRRSEPGYRGRIAIGVARDDRIRLNITGVAIAAHAGQYQPGAGCRASSCPRSNASRRRRVSG